VCNVSAPVVRRWLSLGLLPEPPWTQEQLLELRDRTDPESRRRGNRAPHGTITRWNAGCSCAQCRQFQSDDARARGRRRAQQRLPADVRQQLLEAIYDGQPYRETLRELGLTPSHDAASTGMAEINVGRDDGESGWLGEGTDAEVQAFMQQLKRYLQDPNWFVLLDTEIASLARTIGVQHEVELVKASLLYADSHQSASLDMVCDLETSCDALKAL
jgi:hypothetical protein